MSLSYLLAALAPPLVTVLGLLVWRLLRRRRRSVAPERIAEESDTAVALRALHEEVAGLSEQMSAITTSWRRRDEHLANTLGQLVSAAEEISRDLGRGLVPGRNGSAPGSADSEVR